MSHGTNISHSLSVRSEPFPLCHSIHTSLVHYNLCPPLYTSLYVALYMFAVQRRRVLSLSVGRRAGVMGSTTCIGVENVTKV